MILSGKSAAFWAHARSKAAACNWLGSDLLRMGIFFAPSPAVIGALLAVATLPLHLLLSKMQSEQFAAVLLAVIGAIYVGFGLQTGNRMQIVTEVMGALGFFSAALAGLWVMPWIIPVAYVIHGIWDYAHHKGSRLAAIPLWYPSFCAVYDWVAAGGLVVIWSLRA